MSRSLGYWLVALGSFALGGASCGTGCGATGTYAGYTLGQPEVQYNDINNDGNPNLCVFYPIKQEIICSIDENGDGAQDVVKENNDGQEVLARGRNVCLVSVLLSEEEMKTLEDKVTK